MVWSLTRHPDIEPDVEPDILECEVIWGLGSITMNKASGGDGIPVELFQILKDDAGEVLLSICQQIWKTQQWPQGWKRSVFIPIPKKGNAKECSNYCTIALISHTSKVKLLSRVWLFATLWTVAHQAPPSTEFSRQEYWSGLPFPSPYQPPKKNILLRLWLHPRLPSSVVFPLTTTEQPNPAPLLCLDSCLALSHLLTSGLNFYRSDGKRRKGRGKRIVRFGFKK